MNFHQLAQADLAALARGEYTGKIIRGLQAAEFSKNVLLMEAVRRETIRNGSDDIISIINSALGVLRAAQVFHPGIVSKLLTLPNFGFWASECLIRLQNALKDVGKQREPLLIWTDIGHLATFAAVAALRTHQPCQLKLPIRDGVVFLPTLGYATVSAHSGAHWASFVSDYGGATITCGSWEMQLPIAGNLRVTQASSDWTPVPSLFVRSNGLRISLLLEDSDPFLSQLSPSPSTVSSELIDQWQQRLVGAWQLLTRYHRRVAIGLAEALTTIIPSHELVRGHPITATSGWAWGAVLLSLPPDKVSFAEALTHEFHHLVLAAVEDIMPLIDDAHDDMCYAPWRDDPRPRSTLLQGGYAFFGVTGFWLRQSHVGPYADRHGAQIEFARRRQNVSEALAELNNWAGLTSTGRLFVSEITNRLAEWLAEPVLPSADAIARQLNAEHRTRWLRANRVHDGNVAPALDDPDSLEGSNNQTARQARD